MWQEIIVDGACAWQAREDQRLAIELEPENEQGALNPVEADLCDGHAQAAFDLTGTLWPA